SPALWSPATLGRVATLAQQRAGRRRQNRSAPASCPAVSKYGGDRVETAASAAIDTEGQLSFECQSSQFGDKRVDVARCWLARKRQQLRDQVPILRSEPASVGVRPVHPDRLGGNVCAAFDLNEFKRDQRVLVFLNHPARFDAKVVDPWIEHTGDLGRGSA